ncbi:MAG: hypothetical protein DME92_10660 [Verrucomicrobia bacterium]|nr:MAG: hypothetical protein DME92_10660 [Verrucomicrobiota bacterium]
MRFEKRCVGSRSSRFGLNSASGELISVPHPDHILVGRTRVAVEDDKGVIDVLSALHMTRIRRQERETPA